MIKDLKFETNYEATINTTPLEERYYCSPNWLDYLEDKHFHNSHKGCDTEMIVKNCKDRNLSVNMICHTHNVTCSKTGWEIGWWGRTNSKLMMSRTVTCCDCGKVLETKARNFKRCPDCKVISSNKRANDRLLNKVNNLLIKSV